mgnify:CR=1 FL=1
MASSDGLINAGNLDAGTHWTRDITTSVAELRLEAGWYVARARGASCYAMRCTGGDATPDSTCRWLEDGSEIGFRIRPGVDDRIRLVGVDATEGTLHIDKVGP